MKNKVYIIGPKSSGKTTFIHKMIGADFRMFKDNIVELSTPPEDLSDAIQVYMIMPEEKELEARGGDMTSEEYYEYMEFYHKNSNSISITLVKDF
jgi:GTPase SAR1 family protein